MNGDERKRRIVLDGIHRLWDPAQRLKIAADPYPTVKIIATGSSTLGTSARFRDTRAGRKGESRPAPMVWRDLEDLGNTPMEHRLLRRHDRDVLGA